MEFVKRDAGKVKRIGFSWRRPRGRKNKTKVGKRGHRPLPSKGFRSSAKHRGLIMGKSPVLVHSMRDLDNLKGGIIIIGSSVGSLKRKRLIEACEERNLEVLNYGGRT
jgi:ribosomal protein L32E